MQATLENLVYWLGGIAISPGLGSAELLAAALLACGLIMIGISVLLPEDETRDLEWWER